MKILLSILAAAGAALALIIATAVAMERPLPAAPVERAALPAPNRIDQSHAAADVKSAACLACHRGVEDMHNSPNVVLGCADCHGGNAAEGLIHQFAGFGKDKGKYDAFKNASHVQPLNKESGRPRRTRSSRPCCSTTSRRNSSSS